MPYIVESVDGTRAKLDRLSGKWESKDKDFRTFLRFRDSLWERPVFAYYPDDLLPRFEWVLQSPLVREVERERTPRVSERPRNLVY